MGLREETDTHFGKRVRDERERRGWSQEELAKRLTDIGVPVYASTIAKIENKKQPRAVRLGEATALADVFDTSLDTLLGRSVTPRKSAIYAVRALSAAAEQASWQVSSIETTLRDRIDELVAEYQTDDWMNALGSACERACDQLAEAQDTLRDALNPGGPDSAVKRMIRTMLLEQLTAEERAADEAQS